MKTRMTKTLKKSCANFPQRFKKQTPKIILDRRAAIATALKGATSASDAVLITGKGTDPYLMGARGTKQEWSDVAVAREELAKLGYTK